MVKPLPLYHPRPRMCVRRLRAILAQQQQQQPFCRFNSRRTARRWQVVARAAPVPSTGGGRQPLPAGEGAAPRRRRRALLASGRRGAERALA